MLTLIMEVRIIVIFLEYKLLLRFIEKINFYERQVESKYKRKIQY